MPSSAEPSIPSSRGPHGLLLLGSVIGFASAVGFAWSGGGLDVAFEVLAARNSSGVVAHGHRLIHSGWCQLGVALGGTLVSIGLRLVSRGKGLSLACVLLIGLHAACALIGTLAVCLGTYYQRTLLRDISQSSTAITAEQLTQASAASSAMLSFGWMLLTVASAALLAGSIFQIVTRPKYVTTSSQWPIATVAALVQIGLCGVIVSALWIRCGLAFQEYGAGGPVKASEIMMQLNVLLFCGWFGSCVFLGYALWVTFLAGHAVATASQRTSGDSTPDPG